MKNRNFIFKSQMDAVIYKNWKTDFFKKLHKKENSIVDLLVKRLKQKNFFFFDYSDEIEKHHMTLWFYHVGNRNYDNPYIHDLYLFHEYYHLISFPEKKFDNFDEWKEAMWINELEASLMSEVYIYYFEPELRKYTFSQRIWFDDIIDLFGKENIEANDDLLMFNNHPDIFIKIRERRESVRNGEPVMFKSEEWIASFNNKDDWFEHWRPYFKEVEEIRNGFESNININEYYANIKLKESLHIREFNNIPFYEVALKSYNKLG